MLDLVYWVYYIMNKLCIRMCKILENLDNLVYNKAFPTQGNSCGIS